MVSPSLLFGVQVLRHSGAQRGDGRLAEFAGGFIVEYGGKRFFNDLGQDNYNVSDYTKAYRYRTVEPW